MRFKISADKDNSNFKTLDELKDKVLAQAVLIEEHTKKIKKLKAVITVLTIVIIIGGIYVGMD